jgi:8-oxo-dGTP diphosphatase
MPQRVRQIAAAIVCQGDEILLIQLQGPHDPTATWALPGGGVEDGELITEALIREVREETGLQVHQPIELAYVTQIDDRTSGHQTLAFVFVVQQWEGILQPADPDGVILQAAFVGRAEAQKRLALLPWVAMREPTLAYLSDTSWRSSLWLYREEGSGEQELVGCVAGVQQSRNG